MIKMLPLFLVVFLAYAQAPPMSDRAREGFIGPVQKVSVE